MERKIQQTLVMIFKRVEILKPLPYFCEYGMEIMRLDTQCGGDMLGQGLHRIRSPLSSFYILPGVNECSRASLEVHHSIAVIIFIVIPENEI